MSGGLAFVLDEAGDFALRCNGEMADLEPFTDPEDQAMVRALVEEHARATGSAVAARVLEQWESLQGKFVKVYPRDYRKVIEAQKQEPRSEALAAAPAAGPASPVVG